MLGERADRDLITNGEMKARVEAVFDIADNEKVKALLGELTLTGDEDTASISRELTSAGRNICRINGTDCSASDAQTGFHPAIGYPRSA